ncbi:UvrD-helicase domain-containing protein, partial [bacterium]|nr:UvrD-helicase domain-containing protein [bacterium]
LKIKTIHGFFEEFLHRFPLEAGISPAWSLISPDNQSVLLHDAFEQLIRSPSDSRIGDAFAHIVGRISEYSLDSLLGILTGQYRSFFQVENFDNFRQYFIDTTKKFLNYTTDVFDEPRPENLEKIIDLAQTDVNASKKPAAYLINIINLTKQYIDKTIDFNEYKYAYLTSTETPIANVAKKDYLAAEQQRVYAVNQSYLNRITFQDSLALFDLSAAFADAYRRIKLQHNLLDFDDLILYTRRLFSGADTMGWILSQLDVSLSHILVDEAQDTSPQQWDILRLLAGDFFTDGTTESNPRSLFVVGDSKQSIYGFQGADAAAFALSRDQIAEQIRQNARTICEIPLAQSFRSTAPILQTVDYFFDNPTIAQQTGFRNNPHRCFRADAPGQVELHKLVTRDDDMDRDAYIETIADKIADMVHTDGVAPGDIMVLVQRRNPFAEPLIHALKKRDLDVAGSDRILLPQFPAIRDMLNLVRFCLDTTDDYSLCCTLKSPLFRLTEDDIFNLCHTHHSAPNVPEKPLFDSLENLHPDIHEKLCQIVTDAAGMGPYTFFTHLLQTDNRRQKMIAALGQQIIDPLEEFLTICLSYERTQPGTLRHFLKWFVTGGSEVKRDMDRSSGVRIVTIHGSKGLEAPVVFLIDTVRTPRDKPENVFAVPETDDAAHDAWLWTPQKSASAQVEQAAAAAMDQKMAEYYRLLYVAMTRARDRLYIYGYTPYKTAPDMAWHTQLWNVLGTMPGADITPTEIRIHNETQ